MKSKEVIVGKQVVLEGKMEVLEDCLTKSEKEESIEEVITNSTLNSNIENIK